MPNSFTNTFKNNFEQQLLGKVDQALGLGVRPNDLYGKLTQQAKMARNAEQRSALLRAAGKAQAAANQDAAGLITQAGPQNQAFTPQYGAQAALGEGAAGVEAAKAKYAMQMGSIQQAKAEAAKAAKQQEFENEQTALRNQAYADQVSAQTAAATGVKKPLTAEELRRAWGSDIKEAQAKNVALGNEAITGDAELTVLEERSDFDPEDLTDAVLRSVLTSGDAGTVLGLNDRVLNSIDPQMAAYLRATAKFVTSKLRKESGAAISASEWQSEFTKMLPTSRSEFKAKQAFRQRQIQGLVSSSGAPSKEAFYIAAGFDGPDYNADDWFIEVFGNPGGPPGPSGSGDELPEGNVITIESLFG